MSKSAANSKADTAVKLVLIFFISLFSFSVGTYVGKQVSDSDARRAALEADYNGEEKVASHGESHGDAEDATAPITEEDVANLTDEFVKAERKVASAEEEHGTHDGHAEEAANEHGHAEAKAEEHNSHAADEGYTHHTKLKAEKNEHSAETAHAPAAHSPAAHAPAAHAPANHSPEHASQAAERVSHDMAPTPDAKKTREPSSVLPTVATTAVGKYTVQVASYATEAEAKEQASKLTGKGYSAFYIPATVNGKTWYRVSIGLFSDQKSATNYRTELISTQAVSTAIVSKIVK